MIKDWKKEIFTIPNLLSMFRLVLIPVYVIIYLNADTKEDYLLAAVILAVSCLTDLADGTRGVVCSTLVDATTRVRQLEIP